MPYIDKKEIAVDMLNSPIEIGDVLAQIEKGNNNTSRVLFHIALPPFEPEEHYAEVRDYIAHNVCMCDLGVKGDVINLGKCRDLIDILKHFEDRLK